MIFMTHQNESFQFPSRTKMKTFRCDSLDVTVTTESRLDFFRSSEGGSGSNSSHNRQAPLTMVKGRCECLRALLSTPGMLAALRVLDTLRSLLIPSRFSFYLFMQHTQRSLDEILWSSPHLSWNLRKWLIVLLRMINAQWEGKVVSHQLSKSLYPARLTKKHWM